MVARRPSSFSPVSRQADLIRAAPPTPQPAMSIDQVTATEPARPLLPRFSLAVPDRLRALVRGSEIWLVMLAAAVGAGRRGGRRGHEPDRRGSAPAALRHQRGRAAERRWTRFPCAPACSCRPSAALILGIIAWRWCGRSWRAAGRPDRGQRAARRPHVDPRQRSGRGADADLQRLRRVGRAGGRLYPDRCRHRLAARHRVPPAARRPAHAGRLRRGRRHRGRLRRAADRRVLRLRADHRHLYGRRAGAGADRLGRRRRWCRTCSASSAYSITVGPLSALIHTPTCRACSCWR